MFSRSFASKDRAGKTTKTPKRSTASKARLSELLSSQSRTIGSKAPVSGPITTVVVGLDQDQRLFAAHEELLARVPFFRKALQQQFFEGSAKRIYLGEEDPVVFSCVLEWLYRSDYSPRLLKNKRDGQWYLESIDGAAATTTTKTNKASSSDAIIYHTRLGDDILRDTAVYCAADRYGLEDLKKLALRKQGLQAGIPVAIILRSARFAYDNTPEDEGPLRSHFLELIIRSRKVFKRSGTMQQEMQKGGQIFWDLFVAMSNHLDDLQSVCNTPKTV